MLPLIYLSAYPFDLLRLGRLINSTGLATLFFILFPLSLAFELHLLFFFRYLSFRPKPPNQNGRIGESSQKWQSEVFRLFGFSGRERLKKATPEEKKKERGDPQTHTERETERKSFQFVLLKCARSFFFLFVCRVFLFRVVNTRGVHPAHGQTLSNNSPFFLFLPFLF